MTGWTAVSGLLGLCLLALGGAAYAHAHRRGWTRPGYTHVVKERRRLVSSGDGGSVGRRSGDAAA